MFVTAISLSLLLNTASAQNGTMNGVWSETVLYTFDGAGNGSYADLVRDKAGNFYGTTEFGGPEFAGNVFEVTP